MDLDHVMWRKSSRSSTTNNCVEVGLTDHAVGVRDTKDRTRGTLVFDRDQFAAFTARLKRN